MTEIIATNYTKVTYACGHTKTFGYWQTLEKECWCHAPAVKVERNEGIIVNKGVTKND